MAETLNCPACGAPLDLAQKGNMVVRCTYCESTVILPEIFHDKPDAPDAMAIGPLDSAQVRQLREIAVLARGGKKIEAIKIYRETFAVGLKEAKESVEAIQLGQPLAVSGQQIPGSTFADTGQTITPADLQASRRRLRWSCLFVIILLLILAGAFIFLGFDLTSLG